MNVKWVVRIILLVLLASNVAACRCAAPSAPGAAAVLSAERTRVQCRHLGQAVEDMAVGDPEPVTTGDQINTDQTGLGILTFADFLRVEVFRKSGLQVKAAPDPNAPPIVKLYLALGTTLQGLQRQAEQRVDVTTETDWATIRAVSTTYLISVDDDEVTWVVVFDGEVEVEAQGRTVIVRAGQATWVEPGQPPHAAIDVDLGATGEWLDRLRGTGEVGPIRPVIVPPEEEDQTQPWLEVWYSPSEPNEEQPVTVIAEAGDDESGLDRIEIEMPGQPLVTCGESPCEVTGGPYSPGEFGYEVWAFDKAGNAAHWVGSITVAPREEEDRTEPWLEVAHSPGEPSEEQAVTVVAEAGDDGSGLDRIELQMPGQPLVTCTESPCEVTGGPYLAGEFGYEVRAFDTAGNMAYREGYFAGRAAVVQDNTPVVEAVYVEPATVSPGEGFKITLVASDDVGLESIWWQMKGTGNDYFDSGEEAACGGITWCELSWSLEWIGQSGQFAVYARARDVAGQLSSIESTTITVLVPSAAARFSLSIGGGPFNDGRVQEALRFAIDWARLQDEIGGVVLVDFLSGETLAGPTEPAYDPEQAKRLLEEAGYDGFDTVLLFDPDDDLAAILAEWVAGYLYDVEIYPESVWVDPADARAKLASMIEAGESGLLIERR